MNKKKSDIEKITNEIIKSKIVIFAKKVGRKLCEVNREKYDNSEDLWLKEKCIELAKAISKRLRG